MNAADYRSAKLAAHRISEIILQLPLDELIDMHEAALLHGESEDPVTFEKAKPLVEESLALLKALLAVRMVRLKSNEKIPNQVNATNALEAAQWYNILSA